MVKKDIWYDLLGLIKMGFMYFVSPLIVDHASCKQWSIHVFFCFFLFFHEENKKKKIHSKRFLSCCNFINNFFSCSKTKILKKITAFASFCNFLPCVGNCTYFFSPSFILFKQMKETTISFLIFSSFFPPIHSCIEREREGNYGKA